MAAVIAESKKSSQMFVDIERQTSGPQEDAYCIEDVSDSKSPCRRPISNAGSHGALEKSGLGPEDSEDLKWEASLLDECFAEVLGTAVMIAFGNGVVAQHQTGGSDVTAIHIAWGIAVSLGVLVSHRTSGALLNPAVTISAWSVNGLPGKKVAPFIMSQFIGAFLGAAVCYLFYFDAFENQNPRDSVASNSSQYYIGKTTSSSGIFFTSRMNGVSWGGAFVDEMIATALLMMALLSISLGNENASTITVAGTVGAIVVAIGMSFGQNTGYALNPARDFGPRVFTAIAGWGSEVFTAGDYYFLVPLFAPVIGGVIGSQIVRTQVTGRSSPKLEQPISAMRR